MIETLAQLQIDWSLWDLPLSAQWRAETLCSMLVGTACGVLGCFVVLRRMALIGDALSHAVLPGVVIAFMLSGSAEVTGLLLGALFAGLTTAVLINLVSRFSRTKEDSAIGIVFTALFALGIILISGLPRGTHFDLKCFLFGDPLAVGEADLWMMAVICPAVVGVVALLYHRLKLVSFDPVVAAAMGISVAAYHYLLMGLLSATVVAGLKTTGVILVVAMVITPASAAYQLTNRFWLMLTLAGVFGAASALAGMALAFMTNSPTGPAMVVVAVILFMLAVALSPTHGVVFGLWRRWRLSQHVRREDVLKAMYRLRERDEPAMLPALAQAASLSLPRARRLLARLQREGLIRQDRSGAGPVQLTDAGLHQAQQMVRAHRLWETYLGDHAGLDAQQVHEEAERLEHAPGLAERLDAVLGRPTRDPHGEQIPPPSSA